MIDGIAVTFLIIHLRSDPEESVGEFSLYFTISKSIQPYTVLCRNCGDRYSLHMMSLKQETLVFADYVRRLHIVQV